ncbi:MAG: DUF445 domain-containing protein [Geodermatophilaceae bacterium]|nr:DUF445 domain-containing protein [Geodermatophilaceae bacterium]
MTADDEMRRVGLTRMKLIATGLFLAAAAVFLACLLLGADAGPWVGYVRAAAEASMIGALADWFAVTALFRHPLGIPIPHTAIIPRRKDQIGEALGVFVQRNFLTRSVLGEKLRSLGVARRTGEWLAEPEHARRLGDNLGAVLTGMSQVLRDEDVQAFVDQLVSSRIRSTPAAPILARVLEIAVEGGHHQDVLSSGLRGLGRFLDDNKAVLRSKLGEESPEWVPEWIDDRVFAKAFTALQRFLGEVASTPDHELRRALDLRLQEYVVALRTDPDAAARVELVKDEILEHPSVKEWSASLWGGLKKSLLELSNDPSSELRQRFQSSIVHFGQTLRDDSELQAKLDRWVEGAAAYVVDQYSDDIADLVSGTVAKWDAVETSNRIELQVGRDLQFIRINGTVVGGLAGLLIYSVAQLIG